MATGVVLLAAMVYVLKLAGNGEEVRRGEEALAALSQRVQAIRTQESADKMIEEIQGTDRSVNDPHIMAQSEEGA